MCTWGNADNVVPTDSVTCQQVKSVDGKSDLTCFSLLAGTDRGIFSRQIKHLLVWVEGVDFYLNFLQRYLLVKYFHYAVYNMFYC